MTTLLEDDTRASGQRERSSSPACDSNVAPAVATAPIVEKSDKSVQTIEIKADAKKETASSDDKAKVGGCHLLSPRTLVVQLS